MPDFKLPLKYTLRAKSYAKKLLQFKDVEVSFDIEIDSIKQEHKAQIQQLLYDTWNQNCGLAQKIFDGLTKRHAIKLIKIAAQLQTARDKVDDFKVIDLTRELRALTEVANNDLNSVLSAWYAKTELAITNASKTTNPQIRMLSYSRPRE